MNNLKDLISENEFTFKKKFGQNFLIDQNVLNNIINSAAIDDNTLVIEIGVGAGALTSKIAKKAKNVLGYEIDSSLEPILKQTLFEDNNVKIIYDDFLKRDVISDLSDYKYNQIYIIANLPYYITTPILNKIIADKIDASKIIIMVQKEVGDRINAKPNTKIYSSLTIFIKYYYSVRKLFDVSKNVFMPKPNVDSIILELSKNKKDYVVMNEDIFFKLVRDSFVHKRKNLKNNLIGYDFVQILRVLSKYNFDFNVRAEQLTIDQFVEIANELSKTTKI